MPTRTMTPIKGARAHQTPMRVDKFGFLVDESPEQCVVDPASSVPYEKKRFTSSFHAGATDNEKGTYVHRYNSSPKAMYLGPSFMKPSIPPRPTKRTWKKLVEQRSNNNNNHNEGGNASELSISPPDPNTGSITSTKHEKENLEPAPLASEDGTAAVESDGFGVALSPIEKKAANVALKFSAKRRQQRKNQDKLSRSQPQTTAGHSLTLPETRTPKVGQAGKQSSPPNTQVQSKTQAAKHPSFSQFPTLHETGARFASQQQEQQESLAGAIEQQNFGDTRNQGPVVQQREEEDDREGQDDQAGKHGDQDWGEAQEWGRDEQEEVGKENTFASPQTKSATPRQQEQPLPPHRPLSHAERRQFRSVVPVRVFLESPESFVPEHDSFSCLPPEEKQLYALMFAHATSTTAISHEKLSL